MATSSDQIPPQSNSVEIDLTESKAEGAWLDRGFAVMVWAFVLATVAVLFVMSWVIFKDAQPAIQAFGLKFLWNSTWNSGQLVFGAAPYIYGTLVSSASALLLAFFPSAFLH